MSITTLLSVADWPEKIGTSWYAIGGAFGIVVLVLVGLFVLAHVRFPEADQDDRLDA